MLPIERRKEIAQIIKKEKAVRVNQLSEQFDVTEETVRRDLEKLENEGILKRTYGGAVLDNLVSDDLPYTDREKVNMDQKRLIAKYASQLVDEGETIFIDASTSALEVIKQVDPRIHITVITNSLNAIHQLNQYSHINLIGVGGNLNDQTFSFEGPMTARFIDHYYADKIFFSVKGISKERGLMDSRESLAELKSHMIANSKEVILVIDASKFNRSALIRIIETGAVDTVITEFSLDKSWKSYFDNQGVRVIIAK
ncbi:MAG: DeoR/GlpR transcriptional regulator [Firmicutes bacterium HGW-Firmicutes-2]|jgi:DeoR/GlpR family transcriptional regulator of sugar metabolism|nr:MAG: DeoR/GlpR transcriptional regulator [Firmicutes bacterium HGW-Firmicutes-2]